MWVGGQLHAPAALPPTPERDPYLVYRRLGGRQVRSGGVRKIPPLSGFDPWIFQSAASRYTDNAIPAHLVLLKAK
jgi:hypothetical protein